MADIQESNRIDRTESSIYRANLLLVSCADDRSSLSYTCILSFIYLLSILLMGVPLMIDVLPVVIVRTVLTDKFRDGEIVRILSS